MIANYEKNYFVAKCGKIYSVLNGRFLKLSVDSKGYKVLKRGKGTKDVRVHRIVADIYIPKIDGKNEVNHINGIKTDNRVENLEWVTHQENCLHAYRTGLRSPSDYQRERASQCTKERLSRKCINLETGIIYDSTKDATRKTGIANSTICYWLKKSTSNWKYL